VDPVPCFEETRVVTTENPARICNSSGIAEERIRQAAASLHEEFGVAFGFLDPATGEETAGKAPCRPDVDQLADLLGDGKARAYRRADGYLLLFVPILESGKPALMGCALMTPLAASGTPGAEQERIRLEKWLRAASDRLRLADQLAERRGNTEATAVSGATWEAILTLDHLIRRLRVHKEPIKNQQRILEGAFRMIRAQTLLWVPQQPDAAILIKGDPILSPPECRALASCLAQHPDYRPLEPLICNDLAEVGWANRFPQVTSALAFVLTDQGPVGWVIALNKKPGSGTWAAENKTREESAGFRKSDAAMLTSFVALLELHARGSARYQDLKELLVGLTRSLTAALDAKDSYTYGHSERVARIAVELGREMGLQGDELSDIYLAGLLHDVGKIGIRDSVLGKVEPLTPEEFEHIKQHVTIGYAILSDLRPIRNLLPGVLYHHEHWDGNGYPDGLAGEAIPLLARILAVADAYDAMSTNRPYRDALPCRKVEEILAKGANTQWDKRIIEAFARCRQKIHTIRQRGVGDSLQLAIDGALRIDRSSMHNPKESLPRQVPPNE
jgi:HD-GYP domain-containing protein (c-di-GMP phosphodiesterase class II)